MENQKLINDIKCLKKEILNFKKILRKYRQGHKYYKDKLKSLRLNINLFLKTNKIPDKINDLFKKFLEIEKKQIKDCDNLCDQLDDEIQNLEIGILNYDENPSGLIVQHISGRKGWTDRNNKLPEFFSKLKGEIIIVESHYGIGTLHVLENFNPGQKIKFLTAQFGSNENSEKFSRELKRFKKEFPKIEFKIYPKFYEFHDRYILSENYFVWIGHGIKDYGDKESFLIAVPIEKVLDITKEIKEQFNQRWTKANNLT